MIRWTQRTLGVELAISKGNFSGRLSHPDLTTRRFYTLLSLLDPVQLAAVQSVTMECKSLVMSTAYLLRHLSMQQLRAVSRLEEEFQVEVWGVVEGKVLRPEKPTLTLQFHVRFLTSNPWSFNVNRWARYGPPQQRRCACCR